MAILERGDLRHHTLFREDVCGKIAESPLGPIAVLLATSNRCTKTIHKCFGGIPEPVELIVAEVGTGSTGKGTSGSGGSRRSSLLPEGGTGSTG